MTWRSRLPLGEGITAQDEIDLWGAYLLGERFGALADAGHYLLGNSSTDFDAYYDGLAGNGPPRDRPRKFLEEPVSAFVDRMARERPAGWLRAAGVCLDLSLPELAFVCQSTRDAWRHANQTGQHVTAAAGRVLLIGVPRGASVAEVRERLDSNREGATFCIYVGGSKARRGQVLWAEQIKPVTFELSDYERAVYEQAQSVA